MNRSSVDLSNDLIRDPFAEAILNSYHSEVKDLEKIFSSWRQPRIQSYDINDLDISPFLGYEYFVLFLYHFIDQPLCSNETSRLFFDFLFDGFIVYNHGKVKKITRYFWSVRRNEAFTNLDARFFIFNHNLMTSTILNITKTLTKILTEELLSKDILTKDAFIINIHL